MNSSEEEFVPEKEEEEGPALVGKLRERLKKAVAEKQEYLEGWQRARADFANFRKEEAQLMGHKEESIKAQLAEALIPTLDSFESALRSDGENANLTVLHKQLLGSLQKLGVERYGAPGEKMDPYRYEALQEVPTEDPQQDHTVERVQRSGYSIGDRIIRPAQVSVYVHHS